MTEKYTADELFHFVGWRNPGHSDKNYSTLCKILRNLCISHPPHLTNWGETRIFIDWTKDMLKGELIVPSVTCYADIPFELLAIHTSKYGEFGLSIDRGILVYYGARPVIYMPYNPADRAPSIFGVGLTKPNVPRCREFPKPGSQHTGEPAKNNQHPERHRLRERRRSPIRARGNSITVAPSPVLIELCRLPFRYPDDLRCAHSSPPPIPRSVPLRPTP